MSHVDVANGAAPLEEIALPPMVGGIYTKEENGATYWGILIKAVRQQNGVIVGYITHSGFHDERVQFSGVGPKPLWRYLSGGVPVRG